MHKVRVSLIVILGFFTFGLTYAGDNSYSSLCSPLEQSHSADNKTFIKTWGPKFKVLNEAIPELSPEENKWLDGELKSHNQERAIKALKSKEYAIRKLKPWAQSLDLRTNKFFSDKPESWSHLAYWFIDTQSTYDLVKLVDYGVISRNVIPCEWQIFELSPEYIMQMRSSFAQNILTNNLINSLKK